MSRFDARAGAARVGVVAAALLTAAAAGVATANEPHVPYVPTAPNVVEAMLSIANVGPQDYVIDLGSGDGRIVIAAARQHGARGFGVELDENLVERARERAIEAGVGDRVEFRADNLFITDISRATVLTLYLFPSVNIQLRPKLFAELKAGTRVVSHDFDMELWQPDAQVTVPVPDKPYGAPESQVYFWVIPANAAGTWAGSVTSEGRIVEFRATLSQTFQMLSGKAQLGAAAGEIRGGSLRGESLRFALEAEVAGRSVRHEFEGRVEGDVVAGKVTSSGGPTRGWRARRVQRAAINITPRPADL
jgi:hypothetical protein